MIKCIAVVNIPCRGRLCRECEYGVEEGSNTVQSHQTEQAEASSLSDLVIRKDLDRFKVAVINCDGWIVPPPIEAALKELCIKHNDLIEYLSLDV